MTRASPSCRRRRSTSRSSPPSPSTRRAIAWATAPAVAFDAQGNRLGYGRGTYDRYLPQLREDCQVLGVAFAEQEVEQVPCDEHDCSIARFITA